MKNSYLLESIKFTVFTAISFCSCFCSCSTYKGVPYFHDFADTAKPTFMTTVPFKEPTIKPDDILVITIQTIDNEITGVLNSAASGEEVPNSYRVDRDGYVQLKFAGKIKVAGLTTKDARDLVEKELNKQLNNPIVNVSFGNFKITVLGEVEKPSAFVMPNEKVNIFDALGMAGDVTVYGKRENVLLLRDSTTGKTMIRLNLNSKNIVSSPYFFLKPNDIVYVSPNKNKVAASNATFLRNLSIATFIVSVLALIVYHR